MLTGLGDLVAVLAHNGEVQQRVEVGDDARGHGVSQAVVLGVDQSDLGAHALKEGEGAGVHRTGSAIGHEEDVGLTLGGNLERAVEVLAGVVGGGVDPLHLGEQEGGEFVDENALSVAVRRLRIKLGDAPIKTVYGVGYTWEAGK